MSRFDDLQKRLVALWPSIRDWSDNEQTVVVVPSYSLDPAILELVSPMLAAYEERFLYMLLLLRQRNCRIVFVTSVPVRPSLIDSYLGLISSTDPREARSRLSFVCAEDRTPRPLAVKLLERDDLLAQIDGLVVDHGRAHLAMFNVTEAERDLALRLDLPIFGACPEHAWFGTKTGCRQLFAAEGVPHPTGESVRSAADVDAALARLGASGAAAAVVKLDEGVSGMGNAVVQLPDANVPPALLEQLDEQGGIVEELVVGTGLRSPSVQLRITPLGEVELVSTHDQLLGGASGQVYIGCTFPADRAYAARIAREGMKVGHRLAAEGVRGRFAVDFVVRPRDESWDVFAIEINLRKGGTTHPFQTMHFLADGRYDPEAVTYTAADGSEKYYVAADSLGHAGLRGLSPERVLDEASREGILYDAGEGVVFHMLSALEPTGKFGLTAVASTPGAADGMWQNAAALVGSLVSAPAS